MKTIIELKYKNYTENVIVTEDNHWDVIMLLHNDRDVLNYKLVQQGNIYFEDCYEWLLGYKRGRDVGIYRSLQTRLFKMENRRYFSTDAEAISHRDKIELLERNLENRFHKLSNIERLYT